MFGDQLAALILEIAKKMGADLGREIDPEAAEVLETSTYVDDTLGGGSPEQVDRYMGQRLPDGTYTGTLPEILANVGLKPKVLIQSGETDAELLEQFGNKVLGHEWRPSQDCLVFKLTVNLSKKNRVGERTSPDICLEDLPRLPHMVFTK